MTPARHRMAGGDLLQVFLQSLELSTEAVSVTGRDGVVLYANRAAAVMLGHGSGDELCGRPVWELQPGLDLARWHQLWDQAVAQGHLALQVTTPPGLGPVRAVESNLMVVGVGEDQVALSRLRDVTRAREAALELTLLGRLVAAMHESVVAIDHRLRITSWSPGAEALFGYTGSEALGQSLRELLRPDVSDEELTRRLARLALGEVVENRTRYTARDGRVLTCQVSVTALMSPGQMPTGYVLVSRDETARAAAEEALAASEARYRGVVASMAEGLVVQAADGTILEANPAAEVLLGLSAEQLRGRSSLDSRWRAVHEDGSPCPGDEHPSMITLRTGTPMRGVTLGVHKPDGTLTWLSLNTQLLPGPHGQRTVVTTFSDVTDHRHQAETLRLRERVLSSAITAAGMVRWEWDVPTGRTSLDRSPHGLHLAEPRPGELHGAYLERVVHPEDLERVKAHLEYHLASLSPRLDVEYRRLDAQAAYRWVRCLGQVVCRHLDGQAITVAGFLLDTRDQHEGHDRELEVARLASERHLPEGLLPVCAWCHKVRDGDGHWDHLEHYLAAHFGTTYTHSICPACVEDQFPALEKPEK